MRFPPLVFAIALSVGGNVQAAGTFTPLQTPGGQAIKFSQNGDYLSIFVSQAGGARWDRATGSETFLTGLDYLGGVNNDGTVAGAIPVDGGSQNGGTDTPALSPVGAAAPEALPLPADADNANVYDVADDGSAVGLLWATDWSVSRAYYYSASEAGLVILPVSSPQEASRGNSISADGHVIAGWNDDADTGFRRGVVWSDLVPFYPTATVDGTEYNVGEGSAVSGNGKWVVGNNYPSTTGSSAWRYDVETGELAEIQGIPFAFGVSDDGKTVVGASGFFDTPPRAAYIWTEAHGSQLLTDYMAERAIELPAGWELIGGLTALSGDGTMAAGWTMLSPNGTQSFIVTGLDTPTNTIFANGFDGPPPVQDPGFEKTLGAGGANPYWESGNTNPNGYPSVFYNFNWARTGGYYAEFGGFQDAEEETQYFSQSVVMLSSAPAYLNYWRQLVALPDRAGTMTVSVDGTPVQTVDFSSFAAPDDDYVPVSIDIGSYADGGTHVLRFEYVYPGGGSDGAIMIDDVTIDPTSSESRPASAPASRERPTSWRVPRSAH